MVHFKYSHRLFEPFLMKFFFPLLTDILSVLCLVALDYDILMFSYKSEIAIRILDIAGIM